ncbi:MAG: hypothetical protein ACKV22_05805 [Bryobacteraceae bacterium]
MHLRLVLFLFAALPLLAQYRGTINGEVTQFWDPAKTPQVTANGSIVPGTGDRYNGLVLPGDGWPDSAKGRVAAAGDSDIARLFRGIPKYFNPLRKTNFQPRLSFAWDVFGDGKIAVRGGAAGAVHDAD